MFNKKLKHIPFQMAYMVTFETIDCKPDGTNVIKLAILQSTKGGE